MKIGIYDPYLDDLGGGEKYMMRIAQCLSKKNEVYVFWDNNKDIEALKERFLLDLSKVKLAKNIFSKNVSFLKRLIKSTEYDIIIALSDGSVPFLLSKKTFIHIQQPLPHQNKNIKTKFKLSRISKFFCNSYYTKSYIDKTLGVNSEVLYPPVELKPKNIKKENIIFHVGRFRVRDVVTIRDKLLTGIGDYKKQGFMINTFKKMIDGGLENWKLILAVSIKKEDSVAFEKLKEMTKGFPIDFQINKNNNALWDTYSKAKIYWHASGFGEDLEKHPEFAEHFGISTVEAMGAGAVPVVINAGGQAEIVENGKSGFLWNTTEELIGKTQELIKNERLLGKMSKEAIKRADYFAGERFCSDLFKILSL